jgi:endoglucanase
MVGWIYAPPRTKLMGGLLVVPYVVGLHPNSPTNPHSAPASGGSDLSNIDGDPPQEAHVLYGAVVGGPDEKDRFFDMRSDWVCPYQPL